MCIYKTMCLHIVITTYSSNTPEVINTHFNWVSYSSKRNSRQIFILIKYVLTIQSLESWIQMFLYSPRFQHLNSIINDYGFRTVLQWLISSIFELNSIGLKSENQLQLTPLCMSHQFCLKLCSHKIMITTSTNYDRYNFILFLISLWMSIYLFSWLLSTSTVYNHYSISTNFICHVFCH